MRKMFKKLLYIFNVVTAFLLFSFSAFASEGATTDLKKLDDKQLFIFSCVVLIQLLIIILVEVAIGLKRWKRSRYPKEETASIDNLLAKAMNDNVISYNNNAVVLANEPCADRIEAEKLDAEGEKPLSVNEVLLGLSVNPVSKIDIDSGKTVNERFAYKPLASDGVEVSCGENITPWGILTEGDESREIFMTIEEQNKKSTDSNLKVSTPNFISIGEHGEKEADVSKIAPLHIQAVQEGRSTFRAQEDRLPPDTKSGVPSNKYTAARILDGLEKFNREKAKKNGSVYENMRAKGGEKAYENIEEYISFIADGSLSTLEEKASGHDLPNSDSATLNRDLRADSYEGNPANEEELNRVLARLLEKLNTDDKDKFFEDDEAVELFNKLLSLKTNALAYHAYRNGGISSTAYEKYKRAVDEANKQFMTEINAFRNPN